MKRTLLILAAALVSLTSMAQSWSSEWVPKHEFHIDVFGGLSALNYQINSNFAPNATYPLFTDRLGGGAGLGYTLHFNENWGLTTGAEFAIYRGSFSAANNPWLFFTSYEGATATTAQKETYIMALGVANIKQDPADNTISYTDELISLKENQTLYSVQVPLMAQFMAPLNEQKSNHFYLALGARFLFNIAGNYDRRFEGYKGAADNGRVLWSFGGIPLSRLNSDPNDPMTGLIYYDARQRTPNSSEKQQLYDSKDYDFLNTIWGIDDDKWENITGTATNAGTGVPGGAPEDLTLPGVTAKGKFKPELFNVAGSAELGFRWGLGNGWGLYTGLYVDYGFLSPLAKPSTTWMIAKDTETAAKIGFSDGPVIAHQFDQADVKFSSYDRDGVDPNNSIVTTTIKKMDIATKLASFGAGLKLKLAFGKAAPKKPVQPTIVYVDRVVRDTVVKTNTVTVRDTVVKTNTVIEKEIQVIRDTVTIIKEVPVEIQKTMADLSNTMFDFDKSVIKEVAKGPLNKVVAWLQENPEVKVEISGHTDSKGSDEYNQRLSEARAKAVYEYFIAQGVDKFRLAYAGYGESRPIATNDTEEGRQQNRRVELNIIQ